MGENLWLADWSDDSDRYYTLVNNTITMINSTNSEMVPTMTRLWVYASLGLSQAIFIVCLTLTFANGGIRAGQIIHEDLITAIIKFPISFFDKTPMGRVLNRCGKDIQTVDANLIRTIEQWLHFGFRVLFSCVSICIASPWYFFAIPPFFFIYWKIQRIFVNTTRQLKRIESVSKSPIYSHFGESINGAITIRAYNHERRFMNRNTELIDANSQANYYGSIIAYRWVNVRLEFISHILVLIAALIFVVLRDDDNVTPGKVGFALSTAIMMSQILKCFVRQATDLENHIVSVERLMEYSKDRNNFPFEKGLTEDNDSNESDNWLQEGKIELSDFSLYYKPDNPPALDRIKLSIESGEKIGICGRTGSGKSSLALSLFRLFEPEEKSVYKIDGQNCMDMGLKKLRRGLTIIPQEWLRDIIDS